MKSYIRGLLVCGLVIATATGSATLATQGPAAVQQTKPLSFVQNLEKNKMRLIKSGEYIVVNKDSHTTTLQLEAKLTVNVTPIDVDVQATNTQLNLITDNKLTTKKDRLITFTIKGAPKVKITAKNISAFTPSSGKWGATTEVYPTFALFWDDAMTRPVTSSAKQGQAVMLTQAENAVTLVKDEFVTGKNLYMLVGMEYATPGQATHTPVSESTDLLTEFNYTGKFNLDQEILIESAV